MILILKHIFYKKKKSGLRINSETMQRFRYLVKLRGKATDPSQDIYLHK